MLLSGSFGDVDFVVSSGGPFLATTSLAHAVVERCIEVPAHSHLVSRRPHRH